MDLINRVVFDYTDLEEAFPKCEPGVTPFGSRVMVQIRTPKNITKGGIHIPKGGDAQETEFWAGQVAKVLAVGPVAFRNRTTLAPWPEGDWCEVGDYVRVPKFGGDRWTVKVKAGTPEETEALIIIYNDLDLIGRITGDPTKIKTYI